MNNHPNDSSKLIEDLKRLALAATPGPWVVAERPRPSFDDHGLRLIAERGQKFGVCVYAERDNMIQEGQGCVWGNDMQFIAAANPAAILQLIAALELRNPSPALQQQPAEDDDARFVPSGTDPVFEELMQEVSVTAMAYSASPTDASEANWHAARRALRAHNSRPQSAPAAHPSPADGTFEELLSALYKKAIGAWTYAALCSPEALAAHWPQVWQSVEAEAIRAYVQQLRAQPQAGKAEGCLRCAARAIAEQALDDISDDLIHAQPPSPASAQPTLTVWENSMPESNGKSNFTAILMRKGGDIVDGITIDRSEYPDRVRYEADRVRYLIGELKDRPHILDYDADKHSGYKPRAEAVEVLVSRCGWFGEGRGQCLFRAGHKGHHTCEQDGRLVPTNREVPVELQEWAAKHKVSPYTAYHTGWDGDDEKPLLWLSDVEEFFAGKVLVPASTQTPEVKDNLQLPGDQP